MKKLLSISLILALLAAVLITGTAVSVAEGAENEFFKDHVSISFADYLWPNETYTGEDEYHKYLYEKFNIDMDFIIQNFFDVAEQINTWMNSGDLPTMIKWDFSTTNDVVNAYDQGLIAQWPADWKERFPNLAKTYTMTSANEFYEEQFGGTYIYCVPVYANNLPSKYLTDHPVLYINRKAAEQVGFDLTEIEAKLAITQSEFYNLLKAEKEAGLYEYPFSVNMINGIISKISEEEPIYKAADGQYHWAPSDVYFHR